MQETYMCHPFSPEYIILPLSYGWIFCMQLLGATKLML